MFPSRDAELVKVLDKLLFYLRIVHSVDFYNHSEYPNEDEMPNRCGIMHARGIPPTRSDTSNSIHIQILYLCFFWLTAHKINLVNTLKIHFSAIVSLI